MNLTNIMLSEKKPETREFRLYDSILHLVRLNYGDNQNNNYLWRKILTNHDPKLCISGALILQFVVLSLNPVRLINLVMINYFHWAVLWATPPTIKEDQFGENTI